MSNKIFTKVTYGAINAKNRLVMAPMSRCRATPEGLAVPLMGEYYAQRASAGLIISEGIQPSAVGKGFMNTPGLYSEEQVASWKEVTAKVHEKGGQIVAQIMHAGRIGHPSLYEDAHQSISPSAIAARGQAFTPDGLQDYPVPKEMTLEDIKLAVQEHVQAAINAIEAGFDGIEIHAGNGFLIHQFMAENTNKRTDEYGQSIEGKTRFALEVIQACGEAIGFNRVGVRLSPSNPYNDIEEGNTEALYRYLIDKMAKDLAYLHIMEANNRPQSKAIRSMWRGPLILNPHSDVNAWPASKGIIDIILDTGLADGVCLGTLFLANSDLVERIKTNAPLNKVDESTFYAGGIKGYTDYPLMCSN